jgi:hypothetical protein
MLAMSLTQILQNFTHAFDHVFLYHLSGLLSGSLPLSKKKF